MKSKQLTEILLIVDESGSMHDLRLDTIKNLNKFIKGQKTIDGMARITIVTFDYDNRKFRIKHFCNGIDLKDCKEFGLEDYKPDGWTPLFDAVGKTVTDLTEKNATLKSTGRGILTKKADRFVVAIITDGKENASKEYTQDSISQLIKQKEIEGWNFVYLSANADAFLNATAMGINTNSLSNVTLNYDPNAKGIEEAYCSIIETVTDVRDGKIEINDKVKGKK